MCFLKESMCSNLSSLTVVTVKDCRSLYQLLKKTPNTNTTSIFGLDGRQADIVMAKSKCSIHKADGGTYNNRRPGVTVNHIKKTTARTENDTAPACSSV